jgi:hypothetical protein
MSVWMAALSLPPARPVRSTHETATHLERRPVSLLACFIHAGGTDRQQQHYVIGETVALMAIAKLHLAIWGNAKMSAGFEFLADELAVQAHDQFSSERER